MLLVLNVVGLSPRFVDDRTPHLKRLATEGTMVPLRPVFPAVTCTAQATMLTGTLPSQHGIVANGWYFRDLAQVWLWRQNNALIQGPKLYDDLKEADPSLKIAKMFWWFNMYGNVDFSVTPRPAYPADGRKLPDIYTHPQSLRNSLQETYGAFPLFHFWGPAADIRSTRWITDASLDTMRKERPDLSLVYLPHLDYDLQRFGPNDSRIDKALAEVDSQVGRLIDLGRELGASIVVLSEYGIEPVSDSVAINRILRKAGYLKVYSQIDGEHLDAGASRAFAVADHQVAHVYVAKSSDLEGVQKLLESVDGIERVLGPRGKKEWGLDHSRSGELVAIAEQDRWFSYKYWLDAASAPDYARTVDIHKKPGYDPIELLLDPNIKFPKLKIVKTLIKKKMGFRTLMNVISLDDTLVRGSHGRRPSSPDDGAVLISTDELPRESQSEFDMIDVRNYLFQLTMKSRSSR